MNKAMFMVSALTLTLFACSPEEETKISGIEITEENAAKMAVLPLAFNDFAETERTPDGNASTGSTTLACDSGNVISSATFSDDYSMDFFVLNGTNDGSVQYQNCVLDSVTYTGKETASIAYSDFAIFEQSGSFITISEFENFKQQSAEGTLELNGTLEHHLLLNPFASSLQWNLTVSNEVTEGFKISTATLKTLEVTLASGLPVSGQWEVKGANNSVLVVEVVANGIEYKLNNNQAVLIAWSSL